MRRSAFLASGAVLAAVPNISLAQTLPKLRVAGTPDQDIVGTLYGIQSGLFRKYGVDVEFTNMGSGAAILAAVVGGSLDVGKASTFNVIVAFAKGIPVVVEAPSAIYRSATPDAALLVARDSPIRTGADLNGKTMAVPGLGDYFTIANMAWIDANGGDSRTVKFLQLPGSATAAAIAAGRVDAASLAEPILNAAVSSGQCKIIAHPLDVFGKEYAVTSYIASSAFAAQNADVMARFRKALFEAGAYANRHRDQMITIVAQNSGVDAKAIAAMPPTTVGSLSNLRDPRMYQPMIDAALKYNAIPKGFPYTDLIDRNALSG